MTALALEKRGRFYYWPRPMVEASVERGRGAELAEYGARPRSHAFHIQRRPEERSTIRRNDASTVRLEASSTAPARAFSCFMQVSPYPLVSALFLGPLARSARLSTIKSWNSRKLCSTLPRVNTPTTNCWHSSGTVMARCCAAASQTLELWSLYVKANSAPWKPYAPHCYFHSC